jgi:hypothetical protein
MPFCCGQRVVNKSRRDIGVTLRRIAADVGGCASLGLTQDVEPAPRKAVVPLASEHPNFQNNLDSVGIETIAFLERR